MTIEFVTPRTTLAEFGRLFAATWVERRDALRLRGKRGDEAALHYISGAAAALRSGDQVDRQRAGKYLGRAAIFTVSTRGSMGLAALGFEHDITRDAWLQLGHREPEGTRMSAAQEMQFITLNTGNCVVSRRADVSDYVIRAIRAGQEGVMWAGWSYVACKLNYGYAKFSVVYNDIALSDCWLCWSDDTDEDLWEEAEIRAPAGVLLRRPLAVPWLAVAVRADLALIPATVMLSLADAERCVGWSLLPDPST